jgi:hypothetical protein
MSISIILQKQNQEILCRQQPKHELNRHQWVFHIYLKKTKHHKWMTYNPMKKNKNKKLNATNR